MNEPVLTMRAAGRVLRITDNRVLAELTGPLNRNLTHLESYLGITIDMIGNELTLHGDKETVQKAMHVLKLMYQRLQGGKTLQTADVDTILRFALAGAQQSDQGEMFGESPMEIRTRKKTVEPRSPAQKAYVKQLFDSELVFGLGPAGTGKTYLAVAVAVSKFMDGQVDKIILSRPAVEAGERLGFLPGDMKDKVDPYMQPLYDALHDFLPAQQIEKLIEEKKIEIAPLAFMRGRTLSRAFIVLDEAQNATTMQMKMFLTRAGSQSRMAITGDTSQIDLPKGIPSGLVQACDILRDVDGIAFTTFTASDVMRHAMVAKIITAYDLARKKKQDAH